MLANVNCGSPDYCADSRNVFQPSIVIKCWCSCLPYCTYCGAIVEEADRFCRVCGKTVSKVKQEEFAVSSDDLVNKVKSLLHEGNVRRIVVKDETGRVLLEIPVTVGIVGALLAPWLAALGAIAALATHCTILVERGES